MLTHRNNKCRAVKSALALLKFVTRWVPIVESTRNVYLLAGFCSYFEINSLLPHRYYGIHMSSILQRKSAELYQKTFVLSLKSYK